MNNLNQKPMRKWYAVYTKPRWEKKVATLLSEKKVDNYCPLNRVLRQWKDRKKIVLEPLFHSYVFVHIDLKERELVWHTPGVINFVFEEGKAAVVRDEDIYSIRRFLNEHDNVSVAKAEIKVNDIIRINYGPFQFMEGNVYELRKSTVKVLLPSLGFELIAEIKKEHVEVINK
jgi:transcriptional antiterminator NusG